MVSFQPISLASGEVGLPSKYFSMGSSRGVLASDSLFPTLEQALNSELGLSTERLEWEAVERLGWTHDGGSTSWATLPVVAGVM